MIAILSLSLLLSGGFEAPAVCCSERLLDAPEVIDDKLSGEWTGGICLRLEKVGRKYNVFLPSGDSPEFILSIRRVNEQLIGILERRQVKNMLACVSGALVFRLNHFEGGKIQVQFVTGHAQLTQHQFRAQTVIFDEVGTEFRAPQTGHGLSKFLEDAKFAGRTFSMQKKGDAAH